MAFDDTVRGPDANAYVNETFVDGFFTDRGNTIWAAFTVAEQQAAIVRATDYVDKRFGIRFRGDRVTRDQALEWPRLNAIDNDGYDFGNDIIPKQIQRGIAEYALRAIQIGTLAPDPINSAPPQSIEDELDGTRATLPGGQIIGTRDKLDVLETSINYASPAAMQAGANKTNQDQNVSDFNIPEYPEADMWIKETLRSSSSLDMRRA